MKTLSLAPRGLLLSLMLLLTACQPAPTQIRIQGNTMGTYYAVTLSDPFPGGQAALQGELDTLLARINQEISTYDPDSLISRFNQGSGQPPMAIPATMANIVQQGIDAGHLTAGKLDVTVGPLVNLWGFGFNKMDSVTPQMIDSIKSFVGYQKIRLEGSRIVKDDPRVIINCSAIAKGYACDVIARLLEKEGVENYMVEIGGEVTMKGVNAQGDCWRIGINKPEDETTGMKNEVEEVVQLCKKGGVATSGNYRNYYVKDGKKYAHTIDPRTGYPAQQDILSATVVADDCMTADAYATSFMAMGTKAMRKLVTKTKGIEYFIIYTDSIGNQQIEYSKGMISFLPNRQQLAILENP